MIKQIVILAAAFMVLSLGMKANILSTALAQTQFVALENKLQSNASSNATDNGKTSVWIISCNVPTIPMGEQLEDHCDVKRLVP